MAEERAALAALRKFAARSKTPACNSRGKIKPTQSRVRAEARWSAEERMLVRSARSAGLSTKAIAKALERNTPEIVAFEAAPPPGRTATWVAADGSTSHVTDQEAESRRQAGLGSPPNVALLNTSTEPGSAPGAHAPLGGPMPSVQELHLPAHDWLVDD